MALQSATADEPAMFKAFVEALPTGVIVVGPCLDEALNGAQILAINTAATEGLGKDAPVRAGASWDMALPGAASSSIPVAIWQTARSGKTMHLGPLSYGPSERLLEASLIPLPNADVAIVYSDVQQNKEIERRNRELRGFNRRLAAFGAVVAHDLRAPIRQLRSFAELLTVRLGTKLTREIDECLTFLVDAGRRGERLVEAVYELARLQNHPPSFTRVDLNEIAAAAVRDLHELMETAQTSISVAPLPTIEGNSAQLARLFQNVLSNAIRFGRNDGLGEIEVSATLAGNNVVIDVRDNGEGIAEAEREKIFEMFHRSSSRFEEGLGLGLAICREVTTLHGGEIACTNNPSGGTTLRITLPTSQKPILKRGEKVLVVDDDRANLHLLKAFLNDAGYDARTTPSPEQAETMLDGDKDLSMALIDLHMPTRRGDAIIAERKNTPHLKLILMSDAPEDELAECAKTSGADGYIRRPSTGEELTDALARLGV